jgi:hypothetical protein
VTKVERISQVVICIFVTLLLFSPSLSISGSRKHNRLLCRRRRFASSYLSGKRFSLQGLKNEETAKKERKSSNKEDVIRWRHSQNCINHRKSHVAQNFLLIATFPRYYHLDLYNNKIPTFNPHTKSPSISLSTTWDAVPHNRC